jgi:hypothetical protein
MNPESANSGPLPEPSPGSTADTARRPPDLVEIRAAIRALDPGSDPNLPAVPTGVTAIDGHLPWGGLALPGLHEIVGMPADGAAVAFVAAMLGRLGRGRPVLWSSVRRPGLYVSVRPWPWTSDTREQTRRLDRLQRAGSRLFDLIAFPAYFGISAPQPSKTHPLPRLPARIIQITH